MSGVVKVEFAVRAMRVACVQHPAEPSTWPVVDHLAEQCLAEAARPGWVGWLLEEAQQARSWDLRDFRLIDPSGYYLRASPTVPLTDR